MPVRRILLVAVAALGVPCGLVLGVWAGPEGVPTGVAGCSMLAALIGWTTARGQAPVLAIAAGSASLVTTAFVLLSDATVYEAEEFLGPIELIALYVLLAVVARWTVPLRLAVVAGGVVWTACVVWVLRLVNDAPAAAPSEAPWPVGSWYDLFLVVANVAASAVFPTAAVALGGLPRYLAQRRAELISAVRREQRLELAQDLHDFVAHDLTGIVAQAQAAQFARPDDLEHLRGALERIEHVGVAALNTMDGLVQVLHDGDATRLSTKRIGDVPALVERFRAERGPGAAVQVEIDEELQGRAPPQLQATAYRVVVEGLTNVRRHAAPGCPVTVAVRRTPDGKASIAVLNEGGVGPSDRHRHAPGGTGLAALRERVSAMGGLLEAGPDGAGRWRLQATLPGPGSGG